MDKPLFNPAEWSKPERKAAPAPEPERKVFSMAEAKAAVEEQKQEIKSLYELPLGPLRSWSFSALMVYEQCPYRSYLSRVQKIPEPESEAMNRGTRIHQSIEDFITGKEAELSKEVKHHRDMIEGFRVNYEDGSVEVEGEWGYDRQWAINDWRSPNTWARIKLDLIDWQDENSAVVIDWKSGRKFGNEVKHATQLITYAIGAFMRFPHLEYVFGQMVYVDKNEVLTGRYTLDDVRMFKPKIEERALRMTTATEFPPKPSKMNCKWCPYKDPVEEGGQPPCIWGVKD